DGPRGALASGADAARAAGKLPRGDRPQRQCPRTGPGDSAARGQRHRTAPGTTGRQGRRHDPDHPALDGAAPRAVGDIRMNGKIMGTLVGLIFGFVVLHYGLLAAVFLAVCAWAGWWVGRIADGDVSLAE